MGLFAKVVSLFRREAKDLGDAAEGVKAKFDQELTKREHELEMTPSEKIAALQQQAATTDARLDAIADKASGKGALADAIAEVGPLPVDASLPNVTHIVLPDGRVRSGNDLDQVVDVSGAVHDVPAVEAPTAEDLEKVDVPEIADLVEPSVVEPEVVVDEIAEPPLVEPEAVGDDLSAPPVNDPAAVIEDQPAPPQVEHETMVEEIVEPPEVVEPEAALDDRLAPHLAEAKAIIDDFSTPSVSEPAAVVDDQPAPPLVEREAVVEDLPAPVAEVPEAASPDDEEEPPEVDPSSPDYGKTPAQLKYERARAAANNLLDELRGELKDDGAI